MTDLAEDTKGVQQPIARSARAWADGSCDAPEFLAILLGSRVFGEAGASPGFLAWGDPGSGVVPLFTDLRQLALCLGPVRWFSTTGVDVISCWPDGYDLLLDGAAEQPVVVPSVVLARLRDLLEDGLAEGASNDHSAAALTGSDYA